MGHKIIEAIIEDGQIKYIDKKLPGGRLKVHIIYDTAEKTRKEKEILKLVTETSAIYKELRNLGIQELSNSSIPKFAIPESF